MKWIVQEFFNDGRKAGLFGPFPSMEDAAKFLCEESFPWTSINMGKFVIEKESKQ